MAHGQGATSNKRGGYGKFGRGTRGHGKDKSVKKAERREHDSRYQEAKEATEVARRSLDELIAKQAEQPAMGETPGAIYQRRQRELALARAQEIEDEFARQELAFSPEPDDELEFPDETPKLKVVKESKLVEAECERVYVKQTHVIDTRELPQSGDGNWRFSYQTARIMLKDGYNIAHVIKYTGIGYEDLKDMPMDEEGYYVDPNSLEGEEE